MNTGQTHHDEQTYRDDEPKAAARSARDGPGPVREHPARLVPSSRYRHPGDVIRLIAGGLILIVTLTAVALASSQLVGTDASAVTWLGSDPAGRLLVGLVQVAFVVAATGIVAMALRRRRFRLLVSLAAGAMVAGGALAGILNLVGAGHPSRGSSQPRARLVACQCGVSGPALLAGAVGYGHSLAVAEPPVATGGLDHAVRSRCGATGDRHSAADGADPRACRRDHRGSWRAGRARGAGPADRTRRDRRGAAITACQ